MQLPPPPDKFETLEEASNYIKLMYRFLLYPAWRQIRLIPVADPQYEPDGSTYSKGAIFYDSDDDKFKGYTGSWQEFGDIT